MDNLIVIAIVAVLAIIIAIALYMQFKNKASDKSSFPQALKRPAKRGKKAQIAPPNSVDINSVPQNNDIQQQPVPQQASGSQTSQQASQRQPTVAQTDNLDVATGLINEQRYDEAINELKLKLKSNPTHPQALLALLNVYVLTNNRTEFDKVYSYVQSKADILTLQDAKGLRSSAGFNIENDTVDTDSIANDFGSISSSDDTNAEFDDVFSLEDNVDFDDAPTSATSDKASVNTSDDQSLELELDTDFDSNLDTATNQTDELELSFDDFDDNDSGDSPTQDAQDNKSANDADDVFDFSFDDEISTPDAQSPSIEPSATSPLNVSDVSDIDLDTQKPADANEEDFFDLSFDDDTDALTDNSATDLNLDETFAIDDMPSDTVDKVAGSDELDNPKDPKPESLSTDDEFVFDFDDLEDSLKDSSAQPATATDKAADANQETTDNNTDELTFDLDASLDDIALDDTASDSKLDDDLSTLNTPTTDTPTFDLTEDTGSETKPADTTLDNFDINKDLNSDSSTSSENKADAIDEFDFDLELDDELSDSAQTTHATKPVQVESSDESNKADTTDELDLSDDFDDSLSADRSDEPKTKVLEDTDADTQMPSIETQQDQDEEIVLDWDEPLEEKSTVIQPTDDLSSADTVSLTEPTTTDAQKTIEEPEFNAGLEDTLAQLDAMSMQEFDSLTSEDSEQTQVAPVDDTDISKDTTVDEQLADSPVAPTQPQADKPTTQMDSDFYNAFGFIEELDKSQITLDLAEQYLELGEYDSAKRLINEVLNTHGSTTQKDKAQQMLNRIS